MSLLYQDIIIHRHYNVRIRAIARARVCVCVERLKVVDILIIGGYSLVVSFVFSAPFMR